MFTEFFYTLRHHQVPVTTTEWLTLLEAMRQGFAGNSLVGFYHLGRSLLVKSESYYDQYDLAFREYFTGLEVPEQVFDELLRWLSEETLKLDPANVDLASLPRYDWETIRRMFAERLKEQTERHNGGSRWIGTGGTSPFGHSGVHPGGIRVGGEGRNQSAVKIAAERRFRNYRKDLTLDTRQIKVALKKLRHLRRTGTRLELDIEASIDHTCRNAGEIELVFHPERKNDVKLLLLMDAGGSMLPYARLVNRLFSAADSLNHFRDFKHFYFHNCIYDYLRTSMVGGERVATAHILDTYDSAYKVIIVGDAHMAPFELFMEHGIIDYYDTNDTAGIVWLQRLEQHFRSIVWLNPMPPRTWNHPTISAIGQVFPMYHLSLAGIEKAVAELTRLAH
jgi:hypothetical protein